MNRRTFVGLVAAAGAVIGGGLTWLFRQRGKPEVASAVPVAPDGKPVFPEAYRKNLRTVCERLVPDEPGSVGAAGTNAYAFIEREMVREEMQPGRRLLMRGSVQLDRVARETVGTNFALASPEDQDRVLVAMVGGAGALPSFKPSDFMEMMMALTLEGMLGDPAHGGNKDEAGWQLVGWAMHPPRPCMGDHVCE